MLTLVPFNPEWATHDTLDLHAIYRRPVRDLETDEFARDKHGFVRWDLTTPLPVRSHAKWTAKGYAYVTLSSSQDVIDAAAPEGCQPLHNPKQYLDQARDHGPWNAQQYLADLHDAASKRLAEIQGRVAKYGWEEAETLERDRDPGYVMPASMKAESPRRGRPKKREEVAA